jgi:hypothetical protein
MLKEETRALRKVYVYKTNKGMSRARKMVCDVKAASVNP